MFYKNEKHFVKGLKVLETSGPRDVNGSFICTLFCNMLVSLLLSVSGLAPPHIYSEVSEQQSSEAVVETVSQVK